MKKIIQLGFIIITLSCSSKHKIIDDYIDNVQNEDSLQNVLIEEKTTFDMSYRTFLDGYNLNVKSKKELQLNLKIRKKYLNDVSGTWKKNDFKKFNCHIISKDSIEEYYKKRQSILINKYYTDKFNIYKISKCYRFNNKMFFSIEKKRFGQHQNKFNFVVILKKINGKWVVVEKRESPDLH